MGFNDIRCPWKSRLEVKIKEAKITAGNLRYSADHKIGPMVLIIMVKKQLGRQSGKCGSLREGNHLNRAKKIRITLGINHFWAKEDHFMQKTGSLWA